MGLFNVLRDWIRRDANHYIYEAIPATRTDTTSGELTEATAGEHYFRIWLSEMFLCDDRKWFRTCHPMVSSLVSLQFGSQNLELTHVAGQFRLQGLEPAHLDRVVRLSYPLTPLLPFNGGVVELSAGLLAIKGQDIAQTFIKAFGDFSALLVVPELSAALSIAAPLASAVQDFLGGANGQLALGLQQAFAGQNGGSPRLAAGYYVVILATDSQIDRAALYVKNGQLYRGNDFGSAKPLTGFDYMLFRVQVVSERDDWDALESIQTPYHQALDALVTQQEETAQAYMRVALVEAFKSPDLTKIDRRRVVRELKASFEEAKADMGLPAIGGERPSLADLMARAASRGTGHADIDLDSTLEEELATPL